MKIEVYNKRYQQQVIDLILGIQQNEFHVPITIDDQHDLLTIPSFYQNGKGNFWIALNEGKVVGTIALVSFSNHEVALRKMFVSKNFRGKEFATAQKLFDTLLAWSKEKSINEIYLGTLSHMHAAHAFYRRNGFTEIRKAELPKSFPLVHVDSMFFRLIIQSH
jgi:GNAT superfamily N-acetyltransferase